MRREVKILGYSDRNGVSEKGTPWHFTTIYLVYRAESSEKVVYSGEVAGGFDYTGEYPLSPAVIGCTFDAVMYYDAGRKRQICAELMPWKGGE